MDNQYNWNKNELRCIRIAITQAEKINRKPDGFLHGTGLLDSKEQLLNHDCAKEMLALSISLESDEIPKTERPPIDELYNMALRMLEPGKQVYIKYEEIIRLNVFSPSRISRRGDAALILGEEIILFSQKFETGVGYSWDKVKSLSKIPLI